MKTTALAIRALLMIVVGTTSLPWGAHGKIVHLSAPVMGFSTWNSFADDISETLILEVADAMTSSGLRAAGYS